MRDPYIVRAVNTDKDSGDVLHTSFYGPYPSLSSACAAADALDEHYRYGDGMRVDGVECHTECYVETLMSPPRLKPAQW
jgi:hypothetical protein